MQLFLCCNPKNLIILCDFDVVTPEEGVSTPLKAAIIHNTKT